MTAIGPDAIDQGQLVTNLFERDIENTLLLHIRAGMDFRGMAVNGDRGDPGDIADMAKMGAGRGLIN